MNTQSCQKVIYSITIRAVKEQGDITVIKKVADLQHTARGENVLNRKAVENTCTLLARYVCESLKEEEPKEKNEESEEGTV